MVIIGVTGNIGSGKSTVCQILNRLGAVVIDADKLGHQAYRPHSSAWQQIIDNFGQAIVGADNEIDRQKLGQLVFSCPESLAILNRIVHPQIRKAVQKEINSCRRHKVETVAFEASLLIEAGWKELVDTIWLVVASEEKVIQRLVKYKENSEATILSRLKAQMPVQEKMEYADELIYNNDNLSQLEARIKELWQNLPAR